MKKNITINLFGQLYAIDEDAYQMLECYLESMKSYFSRQEGGEEIADDIEHRVAELLWERREAGSEAVDLNTVKAIIKQIGNPSEIDDSESGQEYADSNAEGEDSLGETFRKGAYAAGKATKSAMGRVKSHISSRRFYRDENDKILGGVCSGLAQYFGGQDPLLWRVVVCALAICSLGITLLLYLLIWIVAPVARTPEEKLRMKGMEVNSTNLSEQIIEDNNEEKLPRRNEAGQIIRAILWVIMIILIGLIVVPLLLMAGSFLFCIIVAATIFSQLGSSITIDTYQHIPNTSPFLGTEHLWLIELLQQSSFSAWGFLIFGLVATVIPIYAFIRLIRKNPDNNMSFGAKVTLTLIWILALVFCIWCFGVTTYNFHHL